MYAIAYPVLAIVSLIGGILTIYNIISLTIGWNGEGLMRAPSNINRWSFVE